MASIASRLCTTPKLLWGYLISKTLDWSKNRQSVDINGIKSVLNKFIKNEHSEYEVKQDANSFFKVEFDPEKHDICSGREVVIIDSFLPEFDIFLLELYRFDDEGEFRLKFHDRELEMSNGSRHKLYGRFSTYSGAERFIAEQAWIQNKKLMIGPINADYDFDSSPIAIAYSEKVRRKVFRNKEISKCIHCQEGLSDASILVEVNEVGLPFDAGTIHQRCLRESDRVLGISINSGMNKHPELQDFDYQKWFSSLDHGQALWAGFSKISQQVKRVFWNSKAAADKSGHLCIKVILNDESYRYVQERGCVQRYHTEKAELICKQFNDWIAESKEKGNPLCYSSNGDIQGLHDNLQNYWTQPLDLIECSKFEVIKYTRGISKINDKIKNFYAPLISFVSKEDGRPLLLNNVAFLVTKPMDLNVYLKNWAIVGFAYKEYRLNIIEKDKDFDRFMSWATERGIDVLVDPFFDKSTQLSKGAIVQDMESLNKKKQHRKRRSLLFIIDNKNGTFTHLFRDFNNDTTLLLTKQCTRDACNCMGCQIYAARVQIYGTENLDIRRTNDNTIALNISDSETEWDESFVVESKVNWSEWEKLVFEQET